MACKRRLMTPDALSSTASFDVDAVMRKWGYRRYPEYGESWFWKAYWHKEPDNERVLVSDAYRFATLLLMRN